MAPFTHPFPFDPTYGYDLARLLAVEPPAGPVDFDAFWRGRYAQALQVDPAPQRKPRAPHRSGFRVWDVEYRSTEDFPIRGWLLEPEHRTPIRGFVMGHGYGGSEGTDFDPLLADAVYLVPCLRGLCRSARAPIPADPAQHVLHDIDKPNRYILGGCAADIWTGVTALLQLYPALAGRIGFMGISFGAGVGALALAWERRIGRAHLNVPTFGHQRLRLSLPTLGSGEAVRRYAGRRGHVLETLQYYDAAVAARRIERPVHVAAALFDPAVAPPGQFAVFNALPGERQLHVLPAGHFDWPGRPAVERELVDGLRRFFAPL